MSIDSLESASLAPAERRALDRLLPVLEERLGERLVSVWLYGSRARGDDPHPESDVDVMVISTRAERDRRLVDELSWDAAEAAGMSPFLLSVQVVAPEWVRGRREIESFFIQEVDRDKLVLSGQP
ncbi:MAG: nucleotidyltransferase domain-containing protein [Solirubrobacterales bacterium]